MKEAKSDILNLSISKNLSLPISLKNKKSIHFQKETSRKFQQIYQKSNLKESNNIIKKKISMNQIINYQLQKHNSNPLKKNIMIINDIIETKTNHFLAIFKDYLITDYIDEFLKRPFTKIESEELLPKFYIYYQNYLKFFCRGMFTDFWANKIIQGYGEYQAELYYNNNYGAKDKKQKKNIKEEKNKNNSSKSISNKSNTYLNKIKLIFNETIRRSINKEENSKLISKYLYKYNTNEISNILYKNQNETLTLNNNTKIYDEEKLISNEISLMNLIDEMIHKKNEKKKISKNKNVKNYINNDKKIINVYKKLLNQSPIKMERISNYNIKNGIFNKTARKVCSIKIFNKNIPKIIRNKNNNISNEFRDNAKTPIFQKSKKQSNIFQRRDSRNNNNLFLKNLTQKNYHKKFSKITTGIGINFATTKNNKKKISSLNTNLNIKNQNNNNKNLKLNGINYRNIDNNLLSTSNSKNKKSSIISNYHPNINNNTNNSKKIINRINHYQYINYKNKIQARHKINKHKQSYSISNSKSIFNNFHININNNIMFLNNHNTTHYNSHKNNRKSNSKSKNKIDDIKLTLNKKNKSRNICIGIDLKKYKTETKYFNNNIKTRKNLCSSIRKYIYLVKNRKKSKDKIGKSKEILIRNKSNIYNNHSCFKIKKIEDSDIIPSVKNYRNLNNSNKNINIKNVQKKIIIFDYKRK